MDRHPRRLRGLPRAGVEPRRLGPTRGRLATGRHCRQGPDGGARRAPRCQLGDRCGLGQRAAVQVARQRARDRDLRPLPRASRPVQRRLACGRPARRWLPGGVDRARPVLRRRADARRGLQPRLLSRQPDARQGRDLLGLPRPAHARAACTRQRRLRPMPRARQVRRGRAPPPSAWLDGRRVRRLPYADDDLHGGRRAARSQLSDSASRPHGESGRAQRLQPLPHRSPGRLGGGCGEDLGSAAEARLPELCRGLRGEGPRHGGRAGEHRPRPRAVGLRAGQRGLAARPPAEPRHPARAARRAGRSRPAGARHRGRGPVGRRCPRPGATAGRPARRPGPPGEDRGGPCARR